MCKQHNSNVQSCSRKRAAPECPSPRHSETPHHHRLQPPPPPPPPLAPSNQLNGVHFPDVIEKTNHHKLVINHTHEERHPCPGTSLPITKSTTHWLLCVRMKPALYLRLAHSLIQAVRRTDSRSFVRASARSNKSPVFSSRAQPGKEHGDGSVSRRSLSGVAASGDTKTEQKEASGSSKHTFAVMTELF